MIHQPTDKVNPRVIMRTNQIFILLPFKCKNVLLSLYNFGFGVVGLTGNWLSNNYLIIKTVGSKPWLPYQTMTVKTVNVVSIIIKSD